VAAQRPSALQVAASIAGLTVVIVGGVLGWVTRPLGALAMCGGAALYLLCNGRYISGQAVSARTKMRRVLPPGIARLLVPSEDEARLGGLLAAAFIFLALVLLLLIAVGRLLFSRAVVPPLC